MTYIFDINFNPITIGNTIFERAIYQARVPRWEFTTFLSSSISKPGYYSFTVTLQFSGKCCTFKIISYNLN